MTRLRDRSALRAHAALVLHGTGLDVVRAESAASGGPADTPEAITDALRDGWARSANPPSTPVVAPTTPSGQEGAR